MQLYIGEMPKIQLALQATGARTLEQAVQLLCNDDILIYDLQTLHPKYLSALLNLEEKYRTYYPKFTVHLHSKVLLPLNIMQLANKVHYKPQVDTVGVVQAPNLWLKLHNVSRALNRNLITTEQAQLLSRAKF